MPSYKVPQLNIPKPKTPERTVVCIRDNKPVVMSGDQQTGEQLERFSAGFRSIQSRQRAKKPV